MDYQNYRTAIEQMSRISWELDAMYEESGGECTEQTELLEQMKGELRTLLTNEGADFLGRWLLQKEEAKKMYKAEKDACDARMKSNDKSIEFIKGEVARLLIETGQDRIKGAFYSFAPAMSVTTKADTAAIKELYYDKAVKALRDAGIPECITVTLGGSVTAVPEGEERPDYFITTEKQTCKFVKPRAKKEE